MVRSQLASSGQRWDAHDALPILERLARRDDDRRDPHIPNLLWWAFERQLRQDRDAVVERLGTAEMQRAPLVTEALLERVARALVSEGSDGDFAACARLLAAAPGRTQSDRLLAGMEEGLLGRRLTQVPAPMAGPLARLWNAAQPAPGVVLIRLAARMGSPPAIATATDMARDRGAPASDRTAMIELLGQLGRPEDFPLVVDILRRDAARRSSSPRCCAGGLRGSEGRPAARGAVSSAVPAVRANPGIAGHAARVGGGVAGRDRASADRRQGSDRGPGPAHRAAIRPGDAGQAGGGLGEDPAGGLAREEEANRGDPRPPA